MRRSTSLFGPLLLITAYYVITVSGAILAARAFPLLDPLLPIGGIGFDTPNDATVFEAVRSSANAPHLPTTPLRLAAALLCTVALMVPISWVYFVTTRDRSIDRSFAYTIIVLPVIVAGVATIVHDNLALAFSLAGVVAAVRFRLTLEDAAQALYIFVAIAVGLGAGISAVGVAGVVSIAFVYLTLLLWKLDYGFDLNTRFFAFLTGRGRDDKEL